jgi:predicted membrane channel-forming protein YqfA (hemolysin III family)
MPHFHEKLRKLRTSAAMPAPAPSARKLAGIALILLLIVLWAAFVASLARFVGQWPILVQAPFYLIMGIAWIIPLKPLIRWIQTGSFRTP